MRILWFVNTLANSSGVKEARLGRNAISGSLTIIERWRPSFRIVSGKMEPLFLAVICGCNAGLYREALNDVYIPRIQRGEASFAASVLGARGALLSVLVHFFENGRWAHRWKRPLRSKVSRRKISSSSSCRRDCTYPPCEDWEHRRCAFVTSARNPCVIPLIVPFAPSGSYLGSSRGD